MLRGLRFQSCCSLSSFVSADSQGCWLSDRCYSLALLSSFFLCLQDQLELYGISSLAFLSSSVSMANLSRLVATISSFAFLSLSVSMANLLATLKRLKRDDENDLERKVRLGKVVASNQLTLFLVVFCFLRPFVFLL